MPDKGVDFTYLCYRAVPVSLDISYLQIICGINLKCVFYLCQVARTGGTASGFGGY